MIVILLNLEDICVVKGKRSSSRDGLKKKDHSEEIRSEEIGSILYEV